VFGVERYPVPNGLRDAAGVAGEWILTRAGQVAHWKDDGSGSTLVTGLSNIVALAAGETHALAIRGDGKVLAWGAAPGGAQPPVELESAVAVAACGTSADGHSLALRRDGTVVAWGTDWAGQLRVPEGLDNVVAIAAGT